MIRREKIFRSHKNDNWQAHSPRGHFVKNLTSFTSRLLISYFHGHNVFWARSAIDHFTRWCGHEVNDRKGTPQRQQFVTFTSNSKRRSCDFFFFVSFAKRRKNLDFRFQASRERNAKQQPAPIFFRVLQYLSDSQFSSIYLHPTLDLFVSPT